MNVRTFVDTNILIYAHDRDARPEPPRIAKLIEAAPEGRNRVLEAVSASGLVFSLLRL